MKGLMAHYVQGAESIKRGIVEGWYATGTVETTCDGPFPTCAACEAHIAQERADIDAYHQGASHQH
jgi:hypothetical protein